MTQFLLFESASGYGLFEVTASDELAQGSSAVQESVNDIARFGKACKLTAFKPFTSAADALEQINAVSESQASVKTSHHACRARAAAAHAMHRYASLLPGARQACPSGENLVLVAMRPRDIVWEDATRGPPPSLPDEALKF